MKHNPRTPANLTAIITDRCTPHPDAPVSELIGRDASPVNKLRKPHFDDNSKRPVRFGWLGEWLDRLSKK